MKRLILLLTALFLVAGPASADGSEDRGYLGAAIAFVENAGDRPSGLYIDHLIAGAAAEQAGLQPGDRIVAVDGTEVTTLEELKKIGATSRPGDRYHLTIERDGVEQTVNVELGERPQTEVYKWAFVMDENRPFFGVEIRWLRPQLAGYFGVESGALIEGVMDGSPAATAGVEAGDVVVAIQGRPLTHEKQLHHLLASVSPGDQVEVEIRRRGGPLTLFVTAAAAKDFESEIHQQHIEAGDVHFGEHVDKIKIKLKTEQKTEPEHD